MKVADAHIDTLTRYPGAPFTTPDAMWNFEKFRSVGGELQYMAIFTPPNLSGDAALAFAVRHAGIFNKMFPKGAVHLENAADYRENAANILLSLEGASPVGNNLDNLHGLYKLGVRCITLTWNHRNFLADGLDTNFGLTSFGKAAVAEMNKLGIIVDVSHLNQSGFSDLLETTDQPFIASHSNAAAIFNHPRNLTDDQVAEIINRKGFIGINFLRELIGNPDEDNKRNLIRHVEHFLKLGCEDTLGMGSDLDGIINWPFEDIHAYTEITDMLGKDLQLSQAQIEKIMYRNLKRVTLEMIG